MENKLEASIVEAGFKNSFTIKNFFFKLSSGDILLIYGKSGSGKTTLLKTLAGLIDKIGGFINGKIRVNDLNIYESDPEEVLNLVTYIPQEPWYGIIGHTIRSEFCHALSIRNIECDLNVLSKYGLREYDTVTYGLSVGQIQRLLLAEALESRTPVLLLDEPLTYIDQDTRNYIIKGVEKFSGEGGIVVVVDHIPQNWARFDPKTLHIDNGTPVNQPSVLNKSLETYNLRVGKHSSIGKETVIKAENIWFKYSSSNYILKGVTIEITKNSIIGFKGSNGSGKSTLLKILAGIYKPNKGRVVRFGRTVYIPENPLLYLTHPTPREELYSGSIDENIVLEAIEIFDLKNVLDRPILKLSSGERRRVALASSYVRGYSIYLLDEPTGGLDLFSLKSFIDMVMYLYEKNCSILIAHHDPRLSDLFDQEYLLTNGVVIGNHK
ncbi:MAG: ATP-binding cassette domain-containing protein [Desulfurococcaceae archaeon]